ncbi:MAG: GNAT family N-acetyltransferase [Acidobacteria bacterium]|nr:GNAT family N-acetyltransferase [Acidobacteriota bacterium]
MPVDRVAVRTHSWTEWPRLASLWQSLAEADTAGSYFLTAPWIECWLEIFGPSLQPAILTFDGPAGEAAGAALLVARPSGPMGLGIATWHLGAAGENVDDEVVSEYSGLLCRPGMERAVAEAFAAHLKGGPWDQLAARCLREADSTAALRQADLGNVVIEVKDEQDYFVDLRGIDSIDGYLQQLSRNTRDQIRRSTRLYQAQAPLSVSAAGTVEQALGYLDQLAALHQATWAGRGEPGAFASAKFTAFHRRLIERTFDTHGVQLLRVTCGDQVVAVLYNFLYQGRALFYQSGLAYEADNRIKPGLVAHTLAADYCRQQGLVEYDFLAGDSQYKRSLSTGQRMQFSVLARRQNLKQAVRDWVRKLRHKLRAPKAA